MPSPQRSQVAHVFRRAGFGATPADLDHYERRGGVVPAVDDLLAGRVRGEAAPPDPAWPPPRLAPDLPALRARWLTRMATTGRVLDERVVLFLHDHFATSEDARMGIEPVELDVQQSIFRRWRELRWPVLVKAVLFDVALASYLDLPLSVKGRPNENLAREVMELFVLGRGVGTERDVRELSRCLTGMVRVESTDLTGGRRRMEFQPGRHDAGIKTVLGRQGRWTPSQAIDVLLSHPAAADHLALSLCRHFAHPEPPTTLVATVRSALIQSGWSLPAALRALLLADEMVTAANRMTVVRSPVEHAVAAQRALGVVDGAAADAMAVAAGQALFAPPNVGGWPGGEHWLSTAWLVARSAHLSDLAHRWATAPRSPLAPFQRPATIAGWGELLGITELSPRTAAALQGYLDATATHPADRRDEGVLALLLAAPEAALA